MTHGITAICVRQYPTHSMVILKLCPGEEDEVVRHWTPEEARKVAAMLTEAADAAQNPQVGTESANQ